MQVDAFSLVVANGRSGPPATMYTNEYCPALLCALCHRHGPPANAGIGSGIRNKIDRTAEPGIIVFEVGSWIAHRQKMTGVLSYITLETCQAHGGRVPEGSLLEGWH